MSSRLESSPLPKKPWPDDQFEQLGTITFGDEFAELAITRHFARCLRCAALVSPDSDTPEKWHEMYLGHVARCTVGTL